MGPIERAVRADVAKLGDLAGTETTLAELAYAVAAALDAGEGQIPNLSKELRLTLKQLTDGHAGGGYDEFSDLGTPA